MQRCPVQSDAAGNGNIDIVKRENIRTAGSAECGRNLELRARRRFCSKSSTLTQAARKGGQTCLRTNQAEVGMYDFRTRRSRGTKGARNEAPSTKGGSLASSGTDQARKGRLVDALAARGDEGRDKLR